MKRIQINDDCQFLKDIESNSTAFSGTNKGIYNLITTIGALKLWTKGIKVNRNFRLKDVKLYFGINGNAETLLYKLRTINEVLLGDL
tara:strand:+ start:2334 stop:2594 length:261 start_codon:yes stop_codon:yes gene_type:complete